jgi:predicted nuclease of predicted toxin-antitoxin system
MNFLIDAQLPPVLCLWLRERGHQAIHVTEREETLADEAIALWAEQEGLILISKDEDFLTLRVPGRFVLLWLRCGNTTNRALSVWLEARWGQVEALLAGDEQVIELL